jgi:hypothetical protein
VIFEPDRTIRSRLYFDNLSSVQVPIPSDPAAWDGVLLALKELDELLLQMPANAARSLAHLIDSLYLARADRATTATDINAGTAKHAVVGC